MISRIRSYGRTRVLAVVVSVAAIIVFAGIYALFFRGSNVDPLTLSAPSATHSSVTVQAVAGTWAIGPGSTAGYRVREKLASIPAASDAVGRTDAMSGNAVFDIKDGHAVLEKAAFQGDVSKLHSDEPRRDNRIRTIGLETDTYPSASFELTVPVNVPDVALTGAQAKVKLQGKLTLHGVTKQRDFDVNVQREGPDIAAAGSLAFPWQDFGMTAPSVGDFVTIQSDPTLEFKLVLHKS